MLTYVSKVDRLPVRPARVHIAQLHQLQLGLRHTPTEAHPKQLLSHISLAACDHTEQGHISIALPRSTSFKRCAPVWARLDGQDLCHCQTIKNTQAPQSSTELSAGVLTSATALPQSLPEGVPRSARCKGRAPLELRWTLTMCLTKRNSCTPQSTAASHL